MDENYKPLPGGDFDDSSLMKVEVQDWPNLMSFWVWARREWVPYRITAITVLEHHFIRTGACPLDGSSEGIPLDYVRLTFAEEYQWWMERIQSRKKSGYDDGAPPYCIQFGSHLLANRHREIFTSDRNMGMLVVCRDYRVEVDWSQSPPR